MKRLREIHLGQCQEVTGEDRTALFLRSLIRWYQYTKVRHGGQKWVSLTRAQWCVELRLTPQQFRLVLEKMKARGLIVCEQHRFKGTTPLFVRPSQKCLELLLNGPQHPTNDGAKAPAQGGSKHPTPLKPLHKPEERTKTASGFAVATPKAGGQHEGSGMDDIVSESKTLKPKKPAAANGSQQETLIVGQFGTKEDGSPQRSAQEIEADFATMPDFDAPDSNKVSTLLAVWKHECASKGLPPTPADGRLCDELVDLIAAVPAGCAPFALAYAIRHWDEFTYLVEKEHGAFLCPQEPAVSFITEFWEALQTLVSRHAEITVSATNKAVQSIAQKPTVDPDNKPMTFEELIAFEEAEEMKAAS